MWFLSLRSAAICLWGLESVGAIQIPLKVQESELEEGFVHYSTLGLDELPIDLKQYQNDIVIRVNYTGQPDLKKALRQHTDISVWSQSSTQRIVDVQLSRETLKELEARFDLSYKVMINDLSQRVFETYPHDLKDNINTNSESKYRYKMTEEVIKETSENIMSEIFFKDYRPLETIDAWLDLLAQSYPEIISIQTIGETHEKRPYKVVHMARDDGSDHAKRKTVVVTGGVHAREWISISSVCYQLYQSLNYYLANPDQNVLNDLDLLFIPVLNPDGYDYSWTTDRLWRKNRQETKELQCVGIDIDHSFDFHWTVSSDWPCGEEYAGEIPFEAKEAQIWKEYLNETNFNHQIYGYIDLHSYSQEVLYPYAYSCEQEPRDEENLIELAYGISKAIRLQSGKTYNVLPACLDKDADLVPDLGAGTSLDYMYHNKAYWAYQLKLRDSGSHGFLLPAKYIVPVGDEIFAGLQYFCRFILQEY